MFREAKIWQYLFTYSMNSYGSLPKAGCVMASIKIEKTKSLLPRNHSVVGVVRDRKVIRWLKHNKAKHIMAQVWMSCYRNWAKGALNSDLGVGETVREHVKLVKWTRVEKRAAIYETWMGAGEMEPGWVVFSIWKFTTGFQWCFSPLFYLFLKWEEK